MQVIDAFLAGFMSMSHASAITAPLDRPVEHTSRLAGRGTFAARTHMEMAFRPMRLGHAIALIIESRALNCTARPRAAHIGAAHNRSRPCCTLDKRRASQVRRRQVLAIASEYARPAAESLPPGKLPPNLDKMLLGSLPASGDRVSGSPVSSASRTA